MPVMEINPRFVSRLYPVVGGKGALWLFCVRCAVVEKVRLRSKQRLHTEGRGRIIVELVESSQCGFICFFTNRPMTLGGGRINIGSTAETHGSDLQLKPILVKTLEATLEARCVDVN